MRGRSSLMMKPSVEFVNRKTFVDAESDMRTVSVRSKVVSPFTGTRKALLVTPGRNVSVFEAAT